MIVKSFELDKIRSQKSNLFLIYGSNQGYKNQIIKEVFTNLFKGEILKVETTPGRMILSDALPQNENISLKI